MVRCPISALVEKAIRFYAANNCYEAMKKNIAILLVMVLLSFASGYLAGGANLNNRQAEKADAFRAGWQSALRRLTDSGFIPPARDFEINSVSGQVTAVQANAVSIKIRPLEPSADPSLDERIIEVEAATKIFVLGQKDQAQYQKEVQDYNKKMQEQLRQAPKSGRAVAAPAALIIPPESLIKEAADISAIKPGVNVSVVAADKNIKDAKSFKAAEIVVQKAPASQQ